MVGFVVILQLVLCGKVLVAFTTVISTEDMVVFHMLEEQAFGISSELIRQVKIMQLYNGSDYL